LKPEVWTAVATILLVVVTALLALIAYLQIRTTQRQLRAYVFPLGAELQKLNAGDVPEYRVVIQNAGQTPAYSLRHIDRFALVEFPLKEPLPEAVASKNFTRTHLGPGREARKIGIAPAPLTANAIDRLKQGTAAIYAYGIIDFVDGFKKPRWVKYRYMTGGNVGFQSDGKLVICEDGNETSDD